MTRWLSNFLSKASGAAPAIGTAPFTILFCLFRGALAGGFLGSLLCGSFGSSLLGTAGLALGGLLSNRFRLYLSGLAYILLEDVRHKMSRKSSLKSSTLITLRNKIILSPVKVTEQKTQIKVEFQPDHPRRGWLRWNLMTA